MGPKKAAAAAAAAAPVDSADPPAVSSSSDVPVEANSKEKSDAVAVLKVATRPSTATMVKEALNVLDSRKGVSHVAICNYIRLNYPSVDYGRLKTLVRKTLKQGIEAGTFLHPASVTTRTSRRFRLAPKSKAMVKAENKDPNVQKAPKPAKDGDKKQQKGETTKTKSSTKSQEDSKSTKKLMKTEETAASKVAPANKPKRAAKEDGREASDSTKTKATKMTKEAKTKSPKDAQAKKVPKSKPANAPASKATGKRGEKMGE